ncbi:MAG: AAA family ATPase [Deltaproteobacteria bacterium]|nr:AAA family ATPase [Deltaproteobacteria bacterium]
MAERSPIRGWMFGVAAAVFAAVGMGIAAIVFQGQSLPPEIPYFEFRLLVGSGLVSDVEVGEDEIQGTARAGTPAETGRYAELAAPFWPAEPGGAPRTQIPFPALGAGGAFRTRRPGGEPTAPLLAFLDEHHVRHQGLAPAIWPTAVPYALGAAAVLALFLLAVVIARRGRRSAAGRASATLDGFQLPPPEIPETRFHDVGGIDEAMDAVLELADVLKMPDRLRRLGATLPRGVLLAGPRGVGKTLLARALAGEAGVPLFRVPAPELAGTSAADAARRVRLLFDRAAGEAPCVVMIEDLEGVARRARREDAPANEPGGTLQALLAELETFDPRSGVVLLAATSRPDVIDPAMLRPGRFDRVLALGRPDRFGREAILRVHAQRVRLSNVSLADVAARTPGLVGAELAALLNEAALIAARREHTAVMREDLETALPRVVDVALRAVRVFAVEERTLLAAHEAGRAVAAAMVPEYPEASQGASLVPRDRALESSLVRRPVEERKVLGEPALKARLVELVAGREAELLLLGGPTTASRDSLAEARSLAAMMCVELEIRAGAGARRVEDLHDGVPEVARLLAEAEARAHQLLVANRPALEEVARRLAERERVSPGDLLRIVHGQGPATDGEADVVTFPASIGPGREPE